MKRFFFSAITLMLAMTACTENGLIDAPEFYGNPIVFDTYIGKAPVTKAENWNIDKLKLSVDEDGGACILAFESAKNAETRFGGVDYTKFYLDGQLRFANPSWGYYENNQLEEAFMPSEKDLAIVAYSYNADKKGCISGVSSDKTEFVFTVKDNVADQVDLLVTPFTLVEENPNGDTKVPLRFYHLLSRVGFKVQSMSTSGTNSTIKISSVQLTGTFPTTGNVDLKECTSYDDVLGSTPGNDFTQTGKPVISPISTPTKSSYELLTSVFEISVNECKNIPVQIHNSSEPTNCYMMIMPGIRDDAAIKITYQIDNLTPKTEEIKLSDLQTDINYFEAGYAYEFLFKISTDAIRFSAEIPTDWDETGDPIPVTPNN